jgi:cyclin L
MGALYRASKLEECPIKMRDLINIYDLLIARSKHSSSSEFVYKPMNYYSSRFYDIKESLVVAEMQILKRLGFQVQVVLPYGTLVNYLQVLGLVSREDVCQRGWGYLNDA